MNKKEELLQSICNNEGMSIIHGTHRNEDLIPVFMNVLFILNPEKAKELWRNNPELLEALCNKNAGIENDPFWQSENASNICFDLFDILSMEGPENYFFGAHIGDGSDFGFWKNEDLD